LNRKLGYGRDEIVGLRVEDILVEMPVGLDTAAFARLINTRSSPRTLKQRCKNGQLLDVEVTVSHLEIDGRPMLCYIAHDITERKSIELELLRNQRRLSPFLMPSSYRRQDHFMDNSMCMRQENGALIRSEVIILWRRTFKPGDLRRRSFKY
jgi:PAS domain S-box-containing protein